MKKKNILLTLVCIMTMSFDANAQLGTALQNTTSKAASKMVRIKEIPATLEEFQALQAELGTTPEGCIMLQLVAMEMYRRDCNVGLECLALNNTETNLNDMKRRLTELFRENDSYARPYLVSACFKGAKPSNGYNPEKPFTIQVRKDTNRQDERSQMLKGYVKHYQLYSEGYDTPWRNIEVVQQKDDKYYRVSNCPAILTQCKEVDFDATEDWKELE